MGNRDKDIRRRLLRRSVLDELELRKFSEIVTSIAAVDVHGVYICIPFRKLYHIGVGSSVVCSTISGNAKASVRGTDNKQFPRLFYVHKRTG